MASSHRIYPYRAADGRFYNHAGESLAASVMHPLCMYLSSFFTRKTQHVPAREWFHEGAYSSVADYVGLEPLIIPLGHSTVLIRVAGLTIITDPIFHKASLLFPRHVPFPWKLDNFPPVDIILISHNHRDHLDEGSVKALYAKNPRLKIYVPQGDRAWCLQHKLTRSFEAMWWDSYEVEAPHGKVTLTFLPAHHWSQRGILDRNRSLWGSWMIQTEKTKVYFAGDTAYGRHFKSIQQEYGNIDVVLMPIAPCDPHEWLAETHVDDRQALQAFCELNAQVFIPIHWGVYWFGIEHPFSALHRLQTSWNHRAEEFSGRQLIIRKFGQSYCFTPVVQSHSLAPTILVTAQE